MNWIEISTVEQLEKIAVQSKQVPCVIFKHSTKCHSSEMAKFILESDWQFEQHEVLPYYLDILQFKHVASAISDRFEVYHQSPQLLLIKNEECTYDADHLDISYEELEEALQDDFWK